MKLADVKIRVKRQFGDESGVQITDEDIVRWANDAQRDIVMRNESVLQTIGTTNSVAGQQAYSFPADLLILRSIHYKREDADPAFYKLRGMSYTEFDEYIDGWEGTAYGPSHPIVYTTYADQIYLFPIPVSSGTDNIKIVYSRQPLELSSDTDNIDLPPAYFNAVVDFCLVKAYQLDEDWNAAGLLSNEYTARVNLNKDRENWNNHEVYPRITVNLEDYW